MNDFDELTQIFRSEAALRPDGAARGTFECVGAPTAGL